MDVLVRSLIWLCCLYLIKLGMDKAMAQQQRKANEKQKNLTISRAKKDARRGWHDTRIL